MPRASNVMNKSTSAVSNAVSNASSAAQGAVSSHSFTTVITILVVLYVLFLAPGTIPRLVSDIFNSTVGKVIALIIVAIVAYHNPLAGIMLAVGVALTVMVANENSYLEKMANVDETPQLQTPDAMPVGDNAVEDNYELAMNKDEDNDDNVDESNERIQERQSVMGY